MSARGFRRVDECTRITGRVATQKDEGSWRDGRGTLGRGGDGWDGDVWKHNSRGNQEKTGQATWVGGRPGMIARH